MKQRIAFWRLVFSRVFTYAEVCAMDWDEFWEAYAALELLMPQKQPKTPKVPKVKRPRRR